MIFHRQDAKRAKFSKNPNPPLSFSSLASWRFTTPLHMDRFKQSEQLAAATREEIPKVAVRWLAAARAPLEKLTMAALNPDLSDAEFLAMVAEFSKKLPALLDTMDHDALAKLMEHGMAASMANGIAQRSSSSSQPSANPQPSP